MKPSDYIRCSTSERQHTFRFTTVSAHLQRKLIQENPGLALPQAARLADSAVRFFLTADINELNAEVR